MAETWKPFQYTERPLHYVACVTVCIVVKAKDGHVQEQRPGQQPGQILVIQLLLAHGHHQVAGPLGQHVLVADAVHGPVAPRVRAPEHGLVGQPRVERVQEVGEPQQGREREPHDHRPVVEVGDVHGIRANDRYPTTTNIGGDIRTRTGWRGAETKRDEDRTPTSMSINSNDSARPDKPPVVDARHTADCAFRGRWDDYGPCLSSGTATAATAADDIKLITRRLQCGHVNKVSYYRWSLLVVEPIHLYRSTDVVADECTVLNRPRVNVRILFASVGRYDRVQHVFLSLLSGEESMAIYENPPSPRKVYKSV